MQTISITSPVFAFGMIPAEYTCDGANYSPRLEFKNIPSNAKSLVLIVEDPDAQQGTWYHWVVFNLPPTTATLEKDADIKKLGGIEGTNSFHTNKYGGPCPEMGRHSYHFKVFALDCMLDLSADAYAHDVYAALEDHIVGKGELIATYQR
ncbi:MAG TPA: YbhB/YbcL family Raf kinase inhibitor-like protein [Candidatus Babeliales bacterium]|nr:YbhB/YbcL family Raf kinase inhibitor-like protein [Candidatus Babeliales bacterium]